MFVFGFRQRIILVTNKFPKMKSPKFNFTKYLRKFKRRQRKHCYWWDWDSGGCFAFAELFQKVFGGECYGIGFLFEGDEEDFVTEHAIVLYEGYLFDAKGLVNINEWIAKDTQFIKHKDEEFVSWFSDDYFSDEERIEIEDILRGLKREFNVYIKALKEFDKGEKIGIKYGQSKSLLTSLVVPEKVS